MIRHGILSSDSVFSRHHKRARLLFGLSDVVLIVLAFAAAYQTRLLLPVERVFYFTVPDHGSCCSVARSLSGC